LLQKKFLHVHPLNKRKPCIEEELKINGGEEVDDGWKLL
jgi:hypothetical protein